MSKRNSSKRKTTKTGYTLFYDELKDKYVEDVRPIYMGPDILAAIREQANTEWSSMSQDKRRPYEMRAEQLRSNRPKCNSLGKSIVEQKRLEQEDIDRLAWMHDEIRQTVGDLFQMGREYVIQEKFYFLHINCYVRTEPLGIVVPCEIALLEYSIKDGGTNVYHKFLRIRNIPAGYACASKEVLEKTHRIPLPPEELSPVVYTAREAYTEILQFMLGKEVGDPEPLDLADINQEISRIPLYCVKAEHEIVKECLGAIMADSGMEAVPLMVSHLDPLLYHLSNRSADWAMDKLIETKRKSAGGRGDVELTEEEKRRFSHFPSKEAAEIEINRELFDHAPEVACEFHEKQDNRKFCSRSWVKRWCFMVSDHVCNKMEVDMIPNRHCQVRALLSTTRQRGFGKIRTERKPVKTALQQSKIKKVSSSWVQPRSATSEDDNYVPVTPARSISAFLEDGRQSHGQFPATAARMDSRSSRSANVPAPNLPRASVSPPPGFTRGRSLTGVGRGGAEESAAGNWDIPTSSALAMQDRYTERPQSCVSSHSESRFGLPRFLINSAVPRSSLSPLSSASTSAQSRASSINGSITPFTINPPRSRQSNRNPAARRHEVPVEPQNFVDLHNEPVDVSDYGRPSSNPNAVFRPAANVENAGHAALRRPLPMFVGGKQDTPPPPSIGHESDVSETRRHRSRSRLSSSPHGSHLSYRSSRHHSHERSRSFGEHSSRRRSASRRRRRDRSASSKERSHRRQSSRHSSRHSRRHRRTESGHRRRSSRGSSSRSRRHRKHSSSESNSSNSPARFSSHRFSRLSREQLGRPEALENVSAQHQDKQSASDGPFCLRDLRRASPPAEVTTPPVIQLCPPSNSRDWDIVAEAKVSRRSPSPMIVYDARYAGPIMTSKTRRRTSTQRLPDIDDSKLIVLQMPADSTVNTTCHPPVLPGVADMEPVVPNSVAKLHRPLALANKPLAIPMHALLSLQRPPQPVQPPDLQLPPNLQQQQDIFIPPCGPQFFPPPPLDEPQRSNRLPPVPTAEPFMDDALDFTEFNEFMVDVKKELTWEEVGQPADGFSKIFVPLAPVD